MDVIAEIAAERARQTEAEGHTTETDDAWTGGELARAAAVYAAQAATDKAHALGLQRKALGVAPAGWPFAAPLTPGVDAPGATSWNPQTPRRDLIKAAALLVAEIERRDRAAVA